MLLLNLSIYSIIKKRNNMKVCIIQIGDIHLKTKEQLNSIGVEALVKSIGTIEKFDTYCLIINGDLTFSGQRDQFSIFHTFMKRMIDELKKYTQEYINIICVPGNHDLLFDNMKLEKKWFENDFEFSNNKDIIINEYKKGLNNYNICMKNLKNKRFNKKEYSKVDLHIENKTISFLLLNSTYMSTISDEERNKKNDIGKHFISNESLSEIIGLKYGDINICVSHFPIGYFLLEQREEIDKLLQSKFNYVLTAHEHLGGSYNKTDDNYNSCVHILCKELSNYNINSEKYGFNVLVIDTDRKKSKKYIFHNKNGTYYKDTGKENTLIEKRVFLKLNEEFESYIETDTAGRSINNYFIFPGITIINNTSNIDFDENEIKDINDLCDCIKKYKLINIKGENNGGKTTLSKCLFRKLYYEGNMPILFSPDIINQSGIERTINSIIKENYKDESYLLDKIMQSDNKIAIIDDYINISENAAKRLKKFLLDHGFHIVSFLSNEIDLDINKQIRDIIYDDESILDMRLNLFSLSNRSKVIKKIIDTKTDIKDRDKVFDTIASVLNKQINLFNLNPGFVVDFAYQYISNYNLNFGLNDNLFGEVYKNNIFTKINNNSKSISVDIAFSILQELAYYFHFNHKYYMDEDEINKLIGKYQEEHRQRVSARQFLNDMINSNILKYNERGEYYFCDKNNLAYFVAMELMHKSNTCDLHDKYLEIFKYISFGINSDIILFLSLLSNNYIFLEEIVKIARDKFDKINEFYFEKTNDKNSNIRLFELSTLSSINCDLKESVMDDEKEISKLEEENYSKSIIELKTPYYYLNEDMNSNENVLKSLLKIIEIICKILPSFAHKINKDLQDEIADIVYTYPNKFIYQLFFEIDNDIERIVSDLYQENIELSRERIKTRIDYNIIRKAIVNLAYSILISLYQLVSWSTTSNNTIITLNEYADKHVSANNDILNLLMKSRIDDFSEFKKMVYLVDGKYKKNIERVFLKIATRNYIIRFSKEIKGDIQALVDKVFPEYKKNLILAKGRNNNK